MLTILQWGTDWVWTSLTEQVAWEIEEQSILQVEPNVGVVTQIWSQTQLAEDSVCALIRNALRRPI